MFRILSQELEGTRVEVHRTHSPEFLEQVKAEEELVRGLLGKLKAQAQAVTVRKSDSLRRRRAGTIRRNTLNILSLARTPAITQTPSETVLEAARIMADQEAGAVVITSTAGKVMGIFTERDALRRVIAKGLDPRQTILDDVMTTPCVTAPVSTSPQDALALMVRNKIRHLPIVDAEKCVLGVVSIQHALMRSVGEKQASLETLAAYVEAGGPG